jgi:hypothetical protein
MLKSTEYAQQCTKKCAAIAQLVERIHGKDEVSGSNPDGGSMVTLNK